MKTTTRIPLAVRAACALFVLFEGCANSTQPDAPPNGGRTTVVFDNTRGVSAVTVYNDYRRESAHKIAEVAPGASSAEIPWQPSDAYPFYFSWTVSLNGVNNFSFPYIPETGRDQKAVRVDANVKTNIVIPTLEETLSSPQTLLSNKSFVAVQNVSSYSFRLQRGSSPLTPDGAVSTVVNAGERALYTINPGAASPYTLLVGADKIGRAHV